MPSPVPWDQTTQDPTRPTRGRSCRRRLESNDPPGSPAGRRRARGEPGSAGALLRGGRLGGGLLDDRLGLDITYYKKKTEDQIVQRLRTLQANGVEHVLLLDTAGDKTSLERFARDVMPLFAGELAEAAE